MKNATITNSLKPPPPRILPSHEIEQISCGLLHDLINPINGLTLYLESLNHDQFKDLIVPIHKTSEYIKKYIEVLRGSFLGTDQKEKVGLHETLSHVTSLLSHKAISSGVKIVTVKCAQDIVLKINRCTVYQILINLISNALDAFEKIPQRKNKTVTISIYKSRHGISIVVIDNAAGIPKTILKDLFSKPCSSKVAGTGVGLIHTNRLIKQDLGGTMTIKTRIGFGTRFHITLPKKYLLNR